MGYSGGTVGYNEGTVGNRRGTVVVAVVVVFMEVFVLV